MFSLLKDNQEPFIIAEVGQNHQGELDLALNIFNYFLMQGLMQLSFKPEIINTSFLKMHTKKIIIQKILLERHTVNIESFWNSLQKR